MTQTQADLTPTPAPERAKAAAMTPSPAVQKLAELPWSERAEALEALVTAEFRAILLMDQDEELPLDTSYFELGFTSLRTTSFPGFSPAEKSSPFHPPGSRDPAQ